MINHSADLMNAKIQERAADVLRTMKWDSVSFEQAMKIEQGKSCLGSKIWASIEQVARAQQN